MDNKEINNYTYDYVEAVYEDSKNAILDMLTDPFELCIIQSKTSKDDLVEYFNDELWTMDSVTGNGSGSYTFNRYLAESYLCHNLYLLKDAWDEFGVPMDGERVLEPEDCDVTIRCYLLRGQIEKVIDDLIKEGKLPWMEEEDDDESEEGNPKD